MAIISRIQHTDITALVLVIAITAIFCGYSENTNRNEAAKPDTISGDDYKELLFGHTSHQNVSIQGTVQHNTRNQRNRIARQRTARSTYDVHCVNMTISNCGANDTIQPNILLQCSTEGRQVVYRVLHMMQNMKAIEMETLLSILPASYLERQKLASVKLLAISDVRNILQRFVTVVNDLVDELLSVEHPTSYSHTTSSGSIYNLLEFIAGSAGHHSISGILGNSTTDILLRTVHFLSQLHFVHQPATVGQSGNAWPPPSSEPVPNRTKVNTKRHDAHPLTRSTANIDLGDVCRLNNCYVNNSACLPDETGQMVCTCLPGYLKAVNASCVPVGSMKLIKHPAIPTSLQYSVDIVPAQSGVSALVKNDEIVLIIESKLVQWEKHIVLIIDGKSKYTDIKQAVSVRIAVQNKNENPQIFNTFLLDGTRKNSLVANILSSTSEIQSHYTYNITSSKPLMIANSLFTIAPNGQVTLARDVSLLDLSGSNLTAMLELSFEVRGQVQGSSKFILLAMFHILVIKDSFSSTVTENLHPAVVLQNRLLPDHQTHFDIRFSKLAGVFQYHQGTMQLKHALDYEMETERHFDFIIDITTNNAVQETSIGASVVTLDVDDEPPVFEHKVYHFRIIDGSPVGTVVGYIKASDPDTPIENLIYTVQGNMSRYFHTAGGYISSRVSVEQTRFGKTVNLTVAVSDGISSSVQYSGVNITIVQYSTPRKMLNYTFHGTILEQSPRNTYVTTIDVQSYTNYWISEHQTMFKINPNTGVVTTLKELDRENPSESRTVFTIMASNESGVQCEQVVLGTLTITLSDINDNSPQFTSKLFNVSVHENQVMDTPLFQTTIFDTDEGEKGTANFTLSGNIRNAFSVNTSNGKTARIWIHKPLDRESTSSINLKLTAMDGRLKNGSGVNTASTTIQVNVIDVNDNAPVFVAKNTNYTISENILPRDIGTLCATDADTGDNGNVTFILDSGGMGYIDIGRHNGTLYSTRTLDRESISVFNVSVLAVDDGKPQQTSSTRVLIRVADENDNAPEFTNITGLMRTVLENQPCDRTILKVHAVDVDAHNTITYSMSNDLFTVDSDTGKIRCTQPLDYENQTYHELIVKARDSGTPSRKTSVTVRINVQDLNDNRPIFSKRVYNINVKQSAWVSNKPIFILRASDGDVNDSIHFNFTQCSRNASKYFMLKSNIVSTVHNSFPPLGNYSMNVSAFNTAPPYLSTSAQIFVNVVPNPPTSYNTSTLPMSVFSKDFRFEVFENRNYSVLFKPIGRLTATDPQGRRWTYRIVDEPSGLFFISASTGDLYYNGQFDREERELHQLMVQANNSHGGQMDTTLVTVNVSDVNDNRPRFLWVPEHTNITLREDIGMKSELAVFRATDSDKGKNGRITYSLTVQTGSEDRDTTDFTIGHESGVLRVVSVLDAERRRTYTLNITAEDHGSPSLQSSMTVTINVLDVNDIAPAFTRHIYTLSVRENAANHTKVNGTVLPKAYDSDVLTATNGWVHYERNMTPVAGSCPFYTAQDGTVNVDGHLDYERTKSYSCIITAYDLPTDRKTMKTSTAVVNINVEDVNDNIPIFYGTFFVFNVSREAAVDSLVTDAVRAYDLDSQEGNGDVVYSLVKSTYFRIDPHTGEIRVQQSLLSAPTTVDEVVIVSDRPELGTPLSSNITISINVMGPVIPQFRKARYGGRVEEESDAAPTDILAVSAWTSPGSGPCCMYSLQHTDFSVYFHVNRSTGVLSQVRRIDREQIGGLIPLTVTATGDSDTVGTGTASIDITVDDVNDNVPVFTPAQQIQIFNTSQEVATGHVIGRISSYDPDDPSTTHSLYTSITSSSGIVVNSSGALIVSASLVKPQVENYSLKVFVVVADGDLLDDTVDVNQVVGATTVCEVIVHVQQMSNSHPPVFSQELYAVDVSPSATRNQLVSVPGFLATDEDGTDVTYAIVAGNVRDVFRLNATAGTLYLQYDIDSSLPDVINLTISATDSGIVQKCTTCVIMVRVQTSDGQARQCYTTDQLNRNTGKVGNNTYLIVVGIIASLLLVSLIAVTMLAVRLRTSRRLIDQLGCTNTILTAPVDDMGRRMRYARSSVNRDYRETRPYTNLMAELSEIFYIETSRDDEQKSFNGKKIDTDTDYESIEEDRTTVQTDHL